MASIKARTNKNGEITSFLITVSLGRDPETQKKISETTSFRPTAKTPAKARKEAESYAVIFEKQVKEGSVYSDGNKITFKQFVKYYKENYLDSQVMKKALTQRTAEKYMECLEDHVIPKIGHLKLSAIRHEHIDRIVDGLMRDGYAPNSIHKVFIAIQVVFKYAYKNNIIFENPCSRCEARPKIERPDLNIWTEEQVERFFETLDQDYKKQIKGHTRTLEKTGESYKVPAYEETISNGTQFKIFYRLAYYGHFRRGEICALTWDDIDFGSCVVKIRHAVEVSEKNGQTIKDPKTKAGRREVSVPPHVINMLKVWKKEQRQICDALGTAWKGKRDPEFDQNFIFIQNNGSLIDLKTPSRKFHQIVRRYNDQCEKDSDKLPEIRLHDLRHTGLSHLIGHGVDVVTAQKRAGHSKASITLDIYSHALPQNDQKACDLLASIVPDTKGKITVLKNIG